ncbi:MAG: hypothetical protein GF331_00710 [Chitinivibrionales bacterium]|nr:hypothetical protein [Chitinivibrionales bacterium]
MSVLGKIATTMLIPLVLAVVAGMVSGFSLARKRRGTMETAGATMDKWFRRSAKSAGNGVAAARKRFVKVH